MKHGISPTTPHRTRKKCVWLSKAPVVQGGKVIGWPRRGKTFDVGRNQAKRQKRKYQESLKGSANGRT